MNKAEQDVRLKLFNTLLTPSHRDLGKLHPVHTEVREQDPLFYRRLASWYWDKGEIRDHKEIFIVNLIFSDFEGDRDIGLALLRKLPPYEVCRVLNFIKGKGGKIDSKEYGLELNIPRSMRTEIRRYLREREADDEKLDSAIIFARKDLKRMYGVLHIAPSKRAQAILFDNEPPEDSKLFALKLIAKESSPAVQARLLIKHKIPYRIASTVIKTISPTVLIALINAMTSQELINNMASLKRRGAFDNPEVKDLIKEKLDRAKKDKRVSAYKAKEAIRVAGVSKDVEEKLDEVTESQIRMKGKISRPTALFVDKSGSMEIAVEVGKRIAAMLSAICETDLWVYAFDTMAYYIPHPPQTPLGEATLKDWEKAFSGINGAGGTSFGVALEQMRRDERYVEQIIIVTDGGENQPPFFISALKIYRQQLKADPNICFVKVPGQELSDHVERGLKDEGILADAFTFTGDYYALPNLLPLISKPSRLELLEEIMNWPLPVRLAA